MRHFCSIAFGMAIAGKVMFLILIIEFLLGITIDRLLIGWLSCCSFWPAREWFLQFTRPIGETWTLTSKHLPPIGEDILFIYNEEVKYGRRGIYTEAQFECLAEMHRDGEYEAYPIETVTKWMFVPEI